MHGNGAERGSVRGVFRVLLAGALRLPALQYRLSRFCRVGKRSAPTIGITNHVFVGWVSVAHPPRG
ncbi:hypothetical protein C3D80_05610 [Cronobacter sakazakii]|nr:hypothetical protein CsakCS09_10395 [Cronobacter sakazakii]EGT4321670.1 hypothetical protein [Cronobacter sakazakii]EGT4949700.1 hypothetical protein [Cronobacter sakazakii]EGT5664335.1 hypothetical protein [Cronobacter sakazakii]EGZ6857562.1 hypothetical protein [Cronobacter sakazakii]